VSAVQLEVVRIYENNVTQYLQDSDLGDASNDWQISRVGRIIAQERIELSSLSAAVNTSRWSRYALDLGKYISGNSSAIYQVRMGFSMDDAVTNCGVGPADFGLTPFAFDQGEDFALGFQELRSQLGGYYGIHGSYADRNWEDRDDPCKPAYYSNARFISQNVISSNLGLIAKRNPDRRTVVFTTDLIAAKPRGGVTVKAYDRQRQEIFSGTTDGDGRVEMTTERAPEVIMAIAGEDVAYLDVYDQPSLPLSRFAIGGTAGAGGIKGAFYTERGVWRPGDSVFLNFVLEDRQQRLPKNYPVEFVLYDPQSRVVERRTVTPAFDSGLYPLTFQTDKGDITGSWRAEIAAGGATYNCPTMIETV
ncbi:MAG: MG2 domain-containing protein, partial [Bacteroidota bacterium]